MLEGISTKRKKLRVSKNRKKTWIKHTDIKDVEVFLEEKRQEERTGGPASEKADELLFFVHKEKAREPVRTRTQKRKQLLEPLRCHHQLLPKSLVPPLVKESNTHPSRHKQQRSWECKDPSSKKSWQHLLEQQRKARELNSKKLRDELVLPTEMHDLWDSENHNADLKNNVAEEMVVLDSELLQFQEEMTKKRPPKVPSHRYQKPSLLSSVEVCSPGASYNPSYEDHQELLKEALQVELMKEKEEHHLERILTEKFPTKDEAPTEASWLKEMSQGLFDEQSETEEAAVCDESGKVGNPPVRGDDRKPKAKKRREKQQKLRRHEAKMKKLERIRNNQIYKLQAIKKEISSEEQKSLVKQDKKAERKIERMYQPHTLSTHKYKAPDLELHVSDELCGELRTLKVEGNILEDRYKSFQRRNMIECRVKQKKKRKYKLKVLVKRSHRNC